jgi:hypothetical protein
MCEGQPFAIRKSLNRFSAAASVCGGSVSATARVYPMFRSRLIYPDTLLYPEDLGWLIEPLFHKVIGNILDYSVWRFHFELL